MRKKDNFSYYFDEDYEFNLYNNVGTKNSPYKNYSMWHEYVYQKYNLIKYPPQNLINFKHYLKQRKVNTKALSSIYSNSTIPLLTIVISILMTFIFSIINVFNSYNHDMYTAFDKEYMNQLGYDLKMIISTMEQAFTFSLQSTIIGAILVMAIGITLFLLLKKKIRMLYRKISFFKDYIDIINQILKENL